MKLIDVITTIISSFLVGISYVIIKYGLDYFPPLTLISIRLLIVGMFVLFIYKKSQIKKIPWGQILLFGLANALGFQALIAIAMNSGLDVATSVIAQQMHVPFSCLIGMAYFNEKLKPKNILGLIVSFIGLVVVVGNPSLNNSVASILLAIVSALFYAMANLMIKKIKDTDPLSVIILGSIIAFPFQAILAYSIEDVTFEYILAAPASAWFSILFLAIGVTIVSLSIWLEMLKKYSVQVVTPFSLLSPVFGILCSMWLLDEKLDSYIIFGSILILGGIGLIIFKFDPLKFFIKGKKHVKPKSHH